MKEMLKTNWTSVLGALFVVAAAITLFQYTVDKGWVSDAMKVGLGLLLGSSVAGAGIHQARNKGRLLLGDLLLGIGACILYATFAFAGIFIDMWEPLLVLTGMVAVTAGLTVYAHRFHSRLLMNIALYGGLLAPLLMRPESDQVFTLFLYLFVLNAGLLAVSLIRGWGELRIGGFAGTWLIYIVYFFHFKPELDGIWNMPIRYALSAYLFYSVGLFLASWRSKAGFGGLDLYLNVANGILFGFWALVAWHGQLEYGFVLVIIGAVFTAAGMLVRKLEGRMSVPAISYSAAGLTLLLLSLNSFGEGVLFNVIMWIGYAALLTALGHVYRWAAVTLAGSILWLFIGVYWYAVTWHTPRGEWFGVYIPFLNWGAFAWIALAALGFYYARRFAVPGLSPSANRIVSRVFALLSHLIVGGLMARQIENIFTVYYPDAPSVYMNLTMSVVWAVYALLLVLWAAYFRERTFRWFGSAVLVLVAVKAIFLDLSGHEALLKAAVLLLLGAVSFLITWVNKKWSGEPAEAPHHSAKAGE